MRFEVGREPYSQRRADTTAIVPRENVVDQLKDLERSGPTQVIFNPPVDGYEECLDELSREVVARECESLRPQLELQ